MQGLRCKHHPLQAISNFCTRQDCQIELCATCICHHTEMHGINGTLPHYENITQTYARAYEMVDSHRAHIEAQKKLIIEFNQSWERKKMNVYEKVQKAKKDVLELVERTFAEIEHKYTQAVHDEEIKIGMKNADKIMKMLEAQSMESEKLFCLQKDLTGIRGPETAKLLFSTVLPQSIELINKITGDFSTLSSYDIILDYHQEKLGSLKDQINGLLTMDVHWPQGLVEIPIIEVVERRPLSGVKNSHLFHTTSSSFFRKSSSIGKPLKDMIIDGNSRLVIESKPKFSVVSGKLNQNPGMCQNVRKTLIFPMQKTTITTALR